MKAQQQQRSAQIAHQKAEMEKKIIEEKIKILNQMQQKIQKEQVECRLRELLQYKEKLEKEIAQLNEIILNLEKRNCKIRRRNFIFTQ